MKMVYNTVIFSIYFYVLFSLEVTCIILREANVREIVIGLDEDSPVWGRGGLSNTILQINSLLNFCIQQRCDVRLNNVVPARHGWKARTNYRGGRNNPRGGSCGALCGPWMWSPSVTWRADAAKDPPDNRRVYEMGELSLNRGYNNIRDATYIPSSFDVCTSAKKTTRTSLCAMRTCCWPGQLQLVGFDDDDRLVIAHDTINSARDGEGRNIDVSSPKERTRAVGEQSSEVRVLIEGQDNWYGKKKILPLCLDYNFLRTENFFRTLFWSKMDPSDPEAIILNAWTRKYHSNWSASIEQGKSCTHTIVAHIRAGDVWGSNRNGQKIHPGKKREKRTTMKYLVRALRYVKDKLEQQLRKEKGHDAEERTEEEDEEEEEEERTEEEEEEEEVVVDHKRREREKEKSSVEYKGERISIIEHVHNDFDRISSSSHRDMRGHEPIHNNSPSVKRTKSSEIMKQRKAFTDTQSVKARNRGKMKNGSRKESRACLHFVTQFSDGSTVRERAFVHEESVLSFIHTALIESQWWIPLDTSLDKESMADVTKHERDALKQCSEGRCVSFDDVFVHAEGQARRWSGRMKGFGPLRSLVLFTLSRSRSFFLSFYLSFYLSP